ncbi:MAG: hypothetical protein WCQ69_09475, partial [Bacteroidales bacterium]
LNGLPFLVTGSLPALVKIANNGYLLASNKEMVSAKSYLRIPDAIVSVPLTPLVVVISLNCYFVIKGYDISLSKV